MEEDASVPSAFRTTEQSTYQEKEMTEPVEVKNVFSPHAAPMAMPYGGYGGGFGGDGMGGLLALALLGGGLNNRRGDDTCDASKAAILETGFDGVNHNINTSLLGLTNQLTQGFTNQNSLDVMAKLGSIEAAIPLAESQVQLALAGSTASINKNVTDAIAASLASQNNINQNVSAQGTVNLIATKDSTFAIASAVRDDGDKTRALITTQFETNLQRQLGVAEAALAELRGAGRIRESEINITNTNTAVAAQQQGQIQAQQQAIVLHQLCAEVRNLANDVQVVRQTQSNVNFGTQTGTAQTSSAANNKVG